MRAFDTPREIDDFIASFKSEGCIALLFTTSWCAECKKLKPAFEKRFGNDARVAVVSMDLDSLENDEMAMRFNVKRFPTICVFKLPSMYLVKTCVTIEETAETLDFV